MAQHFTAVLLNRSLLATYCIDHFQILLAIMIVLIIIIIAIITGFLHKVSLGISSQTLFSPILLLLHVVEYTDFFLIYSNLSVFNATEYYNVVYELFFWFYLAIHLLT